MLSHAVLQGRLDTNNGDKLYHCRRHPHLFSPFFFFPPPTLIISSSVWRREGFSKVVPGWKCLCHMTQSSEWDAFHAEHKRIVVWLLLFTYFPIVQCSGVNIFTSDWTWHLKRPFPAFKHRSNVGQPAFIPPVLSTSPLRQNIRHRVHPCACVGCVSVYLYFAWKGFSILDLARTLTIMNKRNIVLLICQKNCVSAYMLF